MHLVRALATAFLFGISASGYAQSTGSTGSFDVSLPRIESTAGLAMRSSFPEASVEVTVWIAADGALGVRERVASRGTDRTRRRLPPRRQRNPMTIVARADAHVPFEHVAEMLARFEEVEAEAIDFVVSDPEGREARLRAPMTRRLRRLRRGSAQPVRVELELVTAVGEASRLEIALRTTDGERRSETVSLDEPGAAATRLLVMLGSHEARVPGTAVRIASARGVPHRFVIAAIDVARRLEISDVGLVHPPLLETPILTSRAGYPARAVRSDLSGAKAFARPASARSVRVAVDRSGRVWIDHFVCEDVEAMSRRLRSVADRSRAEEGARGTVLVIEADAMAPFSSLAPLLSLVADPAFEIEDVRFMARSESREARLIALRMPAIPDARDASGTLDLEGTGSISVSERTIRMITERGTTKLSRVGRPELLLPRRRADRVFDLSPSVGELAHGSESGASPGGKSSVSSGSPGAGSDVGTIVVAPSGETPCGYLVAVAAALGAQPGVDSVTVSADSVAGSGE